MERQILIECGSKWFEFSKSKTGQLDYVGKLTGDVPDVSDWQKIASSTYFSPSRYEFLADGINVNPCVYVADGVDVSDCDLYSYLIHVGMLLAAVDTKDSLLAGQLYLSRRKTFDQFAQLTQFIMKDFSVEILFSLCYGRMNNINPDEIPLIFNNAKEKLGFDPARGNLEQAFIGWFKKNNAVLTLPLVGTQFYGWDCGGTTLEHLLDNLSVESLLAYAEKIRRAKHDFYASLETAIQAEPYNPHDPNSILVSIEDIDSKLCGNVGLRKAGHIRALAAKVLRQAKPKKMAYKATLQSLVDDEITIRVEV